MFLNKAHQYLHINRERNWWGKLESASFLPQSHISSRLPVFLLLHWIPPHLNLTTCPIDLGLLRWRGRALGLTRPVIRVTESRSRTRYPSRALGIWLHKKWTNSWSSGNWVSWAMQEITLVTAWCVCMQAEILMAGGFSGKFKTRTTSQKSIYFN